jgi:SP family general alpha glucoside:H+ symporter-like MFS transporter
MTSSNDGFFNHLLEVIPGMGDLPPNASAATVSERKMTLLSGLRLYPKAIAWSTLLSATIVMEGYDTTLINNFLAFPAFREAYGRYIPGAGYQISPSWQAALPNGAITGEILGLCLNGILTERFGYKKVVIGALLWLCAFISLSFFAFNIQTLMASTILCGLPWGVFQTLSTTYSSDIMPAALRVYLTSNVNMCWLIGQLISSAIIRALIKRDSKWSYRIPFGLQWVFALSILSGVVFAPESPWWLIRHDKPNDAKKSLLRLTRRGQPGFNADETVALMEHTNEVEKHSDKSISYLDCFRGTNLRRTEIATCVWVAQALCGGPMTRYATYFLEQAGLNAEKAFQVNTITYGLSIIGNIIAWFLARAFGRRTLYLWGLATCASVLAVVGGLSYLRTSPTLSLVIASLIVSLTFAYNCTIGPVCYTLVSEIPSTRLRVKTVIIARITYNVTVIVINILASRMLNPTSWNWSGKTALVFAVASAVCFLWCYFRLPEPKGLTYLELDLLFQNKADRKKFKVLQANLAECGYFSMARSISSNDEWRRYG